MKILVNLLAVLVVPSISHAGEPVVVREILSISNYTCMTYQRLPSKRPNEVEAHVIDDPSHPGSINITYNPSDSEEGISCSADISTSTHIEEANSQIQKLAANSINLKTKTSGPTSLRVIESMDYAILESNKQNSQLEVEAYAISTIDGQKLHSDYLRLFLETPMKQKDLISILRGDDEPRSKIRFKSDETTSEILSTYFLNKEKRLLPQLDGHPKKQTINFTDTHDVTTSVDFLIKDFDVKVQVGNQPLVFDVLKQSGAFRNSKLYLPDFTREVVYQLETIN